jgi:O-succinylbenzoic acid--CoA ligase
MGTLRALVCGCAVTLESAPGPDATGASLVPTMLARLVAAGTSPPPHLRTALTGGGPLDPLLAETARRLGWPVRETYGLTEMGSMVTLDGVPVPGARLRLEDGRILVGGAMRCDGYEGDDGLQPAAEWHVTGDLGELIDGRLRVTGRQAELIVSGGENVAAPEVEAALMAHPLVAAVCVVGLPDTAWGECVAAAIVLRGAIDGDELATWLQPRLAGYKRPRRWRFVDALPRTALGKLQRHLVRGLFA